MRVHEATIHHIYVERDDPACSSRYLHLRIYRDVEDLRKAALAYNRHRGVDDPDDEFGSAYGVFQPHALYERWEHGERVDTTGPFAGVMRLCAEQLTGEVISHESTHAALHLWRMHQWATRGTNAVHLGDGCGPVEEQFAYLLGAIAGEVANVVWKYQQREDTVMARG